MTVVFDGADVVGAHAPRRRLARVRLLARPACRPTTSSGPRSTATTADRPVVVVTNDQAIRRDVAAAGANLVTSDAFLALR